MKAISTMIVALVCVIASASCSAQRLFSEASKVDGVTSVLVTKPMLKLAGASIGNQDGVDVSKLMDKLSSIEVITAPKNLKSKVMELCQQSLAGMATETLVEVKEKDQNVEILAIPNEANPNLYKGLVIMADEKDELTYVYMSGNFTMDELMTAIGTTK